MALDLSRFVDASPRPQRRAATGAPTAQPASTSLDLSSFLDDEEWRQQQVARTAPPPRAEMPEPERRIPRDAWAEAFRQSRDGLDASINREMEGFRPQLEKERESGQGLTAEGLGQGLIGAFKRFVGGSLQAFIESGGGAPYGAPLTALERGDQQTEQQAMARAARQRGELPGVALYKEGSRQAQAGRPKTGEWSADTLAYDFTVSMAQMAPAVVTTVLTRSPGMGSSVMGAQVFGDKYGESREAGRDVTLAAADAAFYAAAEAIPESVVLGRLMKPGGKFLGEALAKRLGATAGRYAEVAVAEAAQEMLTQVLQDGYDAGVLNEDMTLAEAGENMIRAGLLGAGMGVGMTAGAQAIEAPLQRRSAERQKAEDEFRSVALAALDPNNPTPRMFDQSVGIQGGRTDLPGVPGANLPNRDDERRRRDMATGAGLLNQGDIDSAIPTDLIAEGKGALANATADAATNATLAAAGIAPAGAAPATGAIDLPETLYDEETGDAVGRYDPATGRFELGGEQPASIIPPTDAVEKIDAPSGADAPQYQSAVTGLQDAQDALIGQARATGNSVAAPSDIATAGADSYASEIEAARVEAEAKAEARTAATSAPEAEAGDFRAYMAGAEAFRAGQSRPTDPDGQQGWDAEWEAQAAAARGAPEGVTTTATAARNDKAEIQTAADLEAAAQRVETAPTDAQKEAGNYRKAHIKIGGLDVTVENPKGSIRRGVDPDGNPWETELTAHYGYVKGTEGADGDHLDVYIGDKPESDRAFVIDQYDESGNFDEHKTVLGVDSLSEALAVYDSGFSDGSGPERRGGVTEMSRDEFAAYAKGDTTAPLQPGIRPGGLTRGSAAPVAQAAERTPEDAFNRAPERALADLPDAQLAAVAKSLKVIASKTSKTATIERIMGKAGIAATRRAYLDAVASPAAVADIKTSASPKFEPTDYLPQMREYVAGRGALTPLSVGKALGLKPREAQRVLGALAATKDSGIFVAKRSGKVRRIVKRRGPVDVVTFLADNGGVRDDEGHDLRNVGGVANAMTPGVGPLVRREGMSLDEAGEMLAQAGYFGAGAERPTVADVIDLLDRATRTKGAKVYRPEEQAEIEAARATEGVQSEADAGAEVDAYATSIGATLTPEERADVLAALARGEAIEDAVVEAIDRSGATYMPSVRDAADDPSYDVPFGDYDAVDRAGTLAADLETGPGVEGRTVERGDARGGQAPGDEPAGGPAAEEAPGDQVARSASATDAQRSQAVARARKAYPNRGSAQSSFINGYLAELGDTAARGQLWQNFAEEVGRRAAVEDREAGAVSGESQGGMFWDAAQEERRAALERQAEGRLKGRVAQKAPGSDGGLFDQQGGGRELFDAPAAEEASPPPLPTPETVSEAAPEPEAEPAAQSKMIADAGEKIGGARKDRWAERGMNLDDLASMSEGEAFQLVTKDQVWPKPDFATLIEQGMPADVAAVVKLVRDRQAAKPKKDSAEERRAFVEMMGLVRDTFMAARSEEDLRNAQSKVLNAAGWDTSRPSYERRSPEVTRLVFSISKGRRLDIGVNGTDARKAAQMVADGFPEKAEPWTRRFEVRQAWGRTGEDRPWMIVKRGARQIVADGLPSREEAERQAKALYESNDADAKQARMPDRPALDRIQRTGEDVRGGRDVDSADFITAFGFRGVEFGNWVASDERQKSVNLAFDALHDLARVVGVPPAALSLGGRLGLAFGARGSGRAAAHYEPGKLVINLTKTSGAGSLAHEWGHALDHYFGELDREKGTAGQARGASGWYTKTDSRLKDLANLRPEMAAAWDRVMALMFRRNKTRAEAVRGAELEIENVVARGISAQTMLDRANAMPEGNTRQVKAKQEAIVQAQAAIDWLANRKAQVEADLARLRDETVPVVASGRRTDFYAEAMKLSGKAGAEGYWARPTEMLARAFEAYVFDRIGDAGNVSQYLVQGVEADRFTDQGGYRGNPYPAGVEREALNEAFDALFTTMAVRDGERGPELYSLARGGERVAAVDVPAFPARADGRPDFLAARAAAMRTVQGQEVVNDETGEAIRIPTSGIRKITSGNHTADDMSVLLAMPSILPGARLVGGDGDARGRANVEGFRYFAAAVRIGDRIMAVRIVVRADNSGKLLYDSHTVKEGGSGAIASRSARSLQSDGSPEPTVELGELIELVKEAGGRGRASADNPEAMMVSPLGDRAGDIDPVDLADIERELSDRFAQLGLDRIAALRIVRVLRSMQSGERLSGAEGSYYRRVVQVAYGARDGVWTLNHEAIHALRDMKLFKPAEWLILSKAAQRDGRRMDEIRQRYGEMGLTESEMIEEAVADMFADWAAGRMEATGTLLRLFERIMDALRAVYATLSGRGYTTAESLFRAIDRGAVARRAEPGIAGASGEAYAVADDARMPADGADEAGRLLRGDSGAVSERAASESARTADRPAGPEEVALLADGFMSDDQWEAMRDGIRPGGLAEAGARRLDEGGGQGTDRRTAPTTARMGSGRLAQFFHGTRDEFDAFDLGHPNRKDHGWLGRGVYLTDSPALARLYAGNKRGDGPRRVMQVAVRLTDPYVATEAEKQRLRYQGEDAARDFTDLLQRSGYDSVILPVADGHEIVVFDPANARVLRSEKLSIARPGAGPAKLSAEPDPTMVEALTDTNTALVDRLRSATSLAAIRATWDQWRVSLQDRFLPLLRTQESVQRLIGRPLGETENPYLLEELSSGRIGARLEKLTEDMAAPLFEAMHSEGVTLAELETYLYARHAPERNKRIGDINPDFGPGEGSGMSDAEAAAIMEAVDASGKRAALDRLAARVDAILSFAVETRVEAGLLSRADADMWKKQYQHYVPLRGHAELDPESGDVRPRRGSGVNVRGKESERAFGRKTKASDILAYSLLQAEEAIVRAETNRVAQAFYELAKAAPDPEFWRVDKINRRATWIKAKGEVQYRSESRIAAEDKDYTVSLKIDGVEHRVTLNRNNPAARRLAASMRNLDAQQFGLLTRVLAGVNRWLSAANTMLSPEFVVVNAFRDIQTVGINLNQYDIDGIVRKVLRSYPQALAGAWRGVFKKGDTEWKRWYDEFRDEGGRVYFNRVEDMGEIKARVDRLAKDATRGWTAKTFIPKAFKLIEDVNLAVDNAIRLSVYRATREAGMSPKQAASVAKNISVNFNRRGTAGPQINAAYLFANASIQGTAALAFAMKSPKVRKVVAGVVATGFAVTMLNMMLTGDDDDGDDYYAKISDFDKQRNIIVMIPGGDGSFIKIPMPYGYNAFFNLGRNAAEMLNGRSLGDAMADVAEGYVDSFNPLGGTNSFANFVAPTIADPFVDVIRNRDFADRPIQPEPNPFGPNPPKAQRSWPSTPSYWTWLAEAMGSATGGDKIKPGAVDVSPEVVEHFANFAGGAALGFFERLISLGDKGFDPLEEITSGDVPMWRKVVGSPGPWLDRASFYERARMAEEARFQHREYLKADMTREATRFALDNRDLLRMYPMADSTREQLASIRRRRNRLEERREADAISETEYVAQMLALREREERVVTRFNARWNASPAGQRD